MPTPEGIITTSNLWTEKPQENTTTEKEEEDDK
jgi:hypothetical protein